MPFSYETAELGLKSIRVLGIPPADAQSWKHVAEHLALLKRLRELALRWNALERELPLEPVPDDRPDSGLAAALVYTIYLKVKSLVKAEGELCATASRVFPNWAYARDTADDAQRLSELEEALRHHLTRNRLSNV